jgi:hypothetical protein
LIPKLIDCIRLLPAKIHPPLNAGWSASARRTPELFTERVRRRIAMRGIAKGPLAASPAREAPAVPRTEGASERIPALSRYGCRSKSLLRSVASRSNFVFWPSTVARPSNSKR